MADINLNSGITISDINKDIAIAAFLAATSMHKIPDPEWVDPKDGSAAPEIDEYPTTKQWVEAWLMALQERNLLKQINKGIDILNRESTQIHLTSI